MHMQELPVGLGNLRRLRQLTVKGNPLHQPFARCVGDCAAVSIRPPGQNQAVLDTALANTSSCVTAEPAQSVCAYMHCRFIDARGELAVLALLRPEGENGALDLSTCAFEALPSIIWELPGRAAALKELNLTNNRLRTLPAVSVSPAGSRMHTRICRGAMHCAAV